MELCIYPQKNFPIHEIGFEANLNTFRIGRDSSDAVVFPYNSFQSIGERGPGLHLVVDSSRPQGPDIGSCARVCWTFDLSDIPIGIAAVMLSLSVASVTAVRALVLRLHPALKDGERYDRNPCVGEMRVSGRDIEEQSHGHQGGSVMLATLARSDAWWHIHAMHTFTPTPTGKTFAEGVCQQPPQVRPLR